MPTTKDVNTFQMNRKTLMVIFSTKLNCIPTNVLWDSGVEVSIINQHSLKQIIKSTAMDNAKEQLLEESGNKIIALGKVTIEVSLEGSELPEVQDFQVVSTNACIKLLLGCDFLYKCGSITFSFDTHG